MPLQRAVGMVLSFQTPPVKLGGLWLHGYDATWFLRHPGLLVPRRAYGKRVALGRIEVLAQPISDERKTKDAQREGEAGEDSDPPLSGDHILRTGRDDRAPLRRRRTDAGADEAQSRRQQDRSADRHRGVDERRLDGIGDDVPQQNAP